MNSAEKQKGCKVEIYDYRSDFLFLTRKERRGVLKNAKQLLKLQKENNAIFVDAPIPQKENKGLV